MYSWPKTTAVGEKTRPRCSIKWFNILGSIDYASVNSTCAQPPLLPPGYCGAFACLVSPGGGAFANFALPGGRAFAYFKFHSDWGQEIGKIKQNELDCRGTAPLKCLKWHYSAVRSMKNVAVLTEDRAFALFLRPHPAGFDSSRVPTTGNLPSKAKKC